MYNEHYRREHAYITIASDGTLSIAIIGSYQSDTVAVSQNYLAEYHEMFQTSNPCFFCLDIDSIHTQPYTPYIEEAILHKCHDVFDWASTHLNAISSLKFAIQGNCMTVAMWTRRVDSKLYSAADVLFLTFGFQRFSGDIACLKIYCTRK